ncbi:replication protein A 70 kDa DNA-binding subunit C-like [Lotus japonicus]|uniref:replication protein A 70 kDa DNA-binding subunit C-like n=1 Tax=Lotus japonicus TaxID=34305 RepID=UPI00258CD9CB|nr:replication protein A 70 kDa DNA-binding subunit C-like [Lotus japonicus]
MFIQHVCFGKTQLQNSMYSTKLFFNPEIPEVNELRNCKNENQVKTHSLSQKSNYAQTSAEEDFLHKNKRMLIEQLQDCEHEKYVVIKATIKHIEDSDDWWYPACKCNRSLIQRSKLYYCESCKHHLLTAIPRYRIKIRATDESDFVSLVIFDEEGSLILNRTCSEFIDILDKNNTLHIPPAQLLELVDKTFLFKVEIKKEKNSKYEACYRVNRLTDDASIIKKFTELLSPKNLEVDESFPEVIKTNPQKTEIAKMNSKDLMTDFTASIDDELKSEEVKQKRKYHSPSVTKKAPFKKTYTRKKGTADGEASDVPNNKIIQKIKKEKI